MKTNNQAMLSVSTSLEPLLLLRLYREKIWSTWESWEPHCCRGGMRSALLQLDFPDAVTFILNPTADPQLN